MPKRLLATLAAFAAMSAPSALMAADLCAHPFDTAGPCFKTYTVIAIPYMAILSTYGIAPLVMLKPRFRSSRAWAASLLATPLVNYVGILLAFTVISALGLARYPHDTTPYYYIDWTVMVSALLLQSLYVGAVIKGFATAPRVAAS